MPERRFPPPWSVDRTSGGHFRIADANGLALAFVYVRDERAGSFDGLTEDEARRIAGNIAKLPELLNLDNLSTTTTRRMQERRSPLLAALPPEVSPKPNSTAKHN